MYPEGKITCDGRRGEMSPAVAKLLKLLALPVVVCCIKGCYLFRPKWAYKKRKSGGVEVHINPLFSTEEMKTLSVEEIFDKVLKAFEHDEFEWQKQNGIRITEPFRAEGLDRILYKCPHCKEEFETGSLGDTVFCSACGKQWKLSETGRLAAADGETEYESIPDWYDFQRKARERRWRTVISIQRGARLTPCPTSRAGSCWEKAVLCSTATRLPIPATTATI